MPGYKVIHDSVHGTVKVDGVFLKLLERPEVQRLHGIHQLGLAHLVFPGANHTRLEHSLGTYHVASKLCSNLDIDEHDRMEVRAAAMLHDIGHTPFSHTLEEVLVHKLGKDHMDVSKEIIVGDFTPYQGRDQEVVGDIKSLPCVLEDADLSPKNIAGLVTSAQRQELGQSILTIEGEQAHFGKDNFLNQIISGPLDVDQMDYLLRDAYYTGVAHGTIDTDRLFQTIVIHHGDLVVDKSGLVAVEGLLVARSLMYTSVYFHKTVRIAEMMMCKAVEAAPESILQDLFVDTDCSLSSKLALIEGVSSRIVTMLRYRRLYKKAYTLPMMNMNESQASALIPLVKYDNRKTKEREIADRAGVSVDDVILDVPEKALLLSEPRIGETDVGILDRGRVRPLSRYSPLAKAIQSRGVHDWAVMVSAPANHRDAVEKVAYKVLFS
ncbi:MAG: HD domain-containing protein [Euryarchaeota archaeon]|nr:HD domain-containing protein [Euryarchaeota archaeon]